MRIPTDRTNATGISYVYVLIVPNNVEDKLHTHYHDFSCHPTMCSMIFNIDHL